MYKIFIQTIIHWYARNSPKITQKCHFRPKIGSHLNLGCYQGILLLQKFDPRHDIPPKNLYLSFVSPRDLDTTLKGSNLCGVGTHAVRKGAFIS